MVKTHGSYDKVPRRKTRSDRGIKRRLFKGKPPKHLRFKKHYNRFIGNKSTIIIRPIWRVSMSRDGYNNWKTQLRPKLCKEISNMKASPSFEVSTSEINTKQKIENWIAQNKWEGKFVIMGVSHARTKTHRKWVNICTVVVRETPDGMVGKMIANKRLSKYSWFYKD